MPKEGDMNARAFPPAGVIVTAAFILAGACVELAANLPGHMSYDSIEQLSQGRIGIYNTWHPPVMAWLLGIADALIPGAVLFVMFETILCFGAFLSLLVFAAPKPVWPSALAAVLFILTPQLMLYQGLVWKDVLFADAAVASFVCLAHVARVWPNYGRRLAVATLAFALAALASLVRQNGIVVLPFAAAALGWIAMRRTASRRTGLEYGSVALIATVLAVLAAGWLLSFRGDGEPATREQLKLLQVYDLAGALTIDPALPLDRLSANEPALERAVRTEGVRLYSPVRNDPMIESPIVERAMAMANDGVVTRQWFDLIVGHPWLYLRTRAQIFWWVLATPDIEASRPVFTGIDGPPRQMRNLGIVPPRDSRDLALESYGRFFEHTPVFSHFTFAALALGSAVLMLRRRRPEDIAMALLLLAAFAFSASFFVISISCDYRYLYVLDLSTMMALFYLSLDTKSLFEASR